MTKPTKWPLCTVKTQISPGIHPDWSESLLSAWRNTGSSSYPLSTLQRLWSDGQIPRLICVFAGCTDHFVSFVMRQPKVNPLSPSWLLSLQTRWVHLSFKECLLYVYLSHVMRKPVYAIWEQQRRRSACASMQSDSAFVVRRLDSIMSLPSICANFMALASFCSWAEQLESYLVENRKRFSRDVAHFRQSLCFLFVKITKTYIQ